MLLEQKGFLYKLLAVVFILLLLTPCTIKSNIKGSLNISSSITNKDRLTTNSSCSVFSTNKKNSQSIAHSIVAKNDSIKLLEKNTSVALCSKTLNLESKRVQDDVYFYTVPIFIHFRELII